jgi:mono/diheme cytochrome c family protein
VPYGRDHANPPVSAEPAWDRPETRETFFRACKDCHSNETEWPWYGAVAPVSWLLQHDVDEGREHFNVSEWGRKKNDGDEAAEMVREGEMPPWFFLPAHPEARLSAAEQRAFVAGLVATFGDEAAGDHEEHDH